MLRSATTTAVLAVLASVSFAPAADKAEKPKRPSGAWSHTIQDATIAFKFEDETLQVEFTKTDGTAVATDAAYGVTADGLVFAVITGVEKKGTDEGPEKGDLFSFQYKIDKDGLTVSDLNGSKSPSDAAKQLIEGRYTKKTK